MGCRRRQVKTVYPSLALQMPITVVVLSLERDPDSSAPVGQRHQARGALRRTGQVSKKTC